MKYLYVKYNHYVNFINENKNDRLCKNLKIYASSKNGLINEIFTEPLNTEYTIEENNDNILISFYTKNYNKYRLDIFKIIEKDKSDDYINHISYSDYDNKLELLNRIYFILMDLLNKNIINNSFCIGGTKLISKNNIYQYLLKTIVGENGFKKLNTDVYKDTKFGLYFKI